MAMRYRGGLAGFGWAALLAVGSALALSLGLAGCASPGPPHAPSLFLPAAPKDLKALREGDRVTLTFTAPMRTSDNLPLKPGTTMRVGFCRQVERAACVAVAGAEHEVAASKPGAPQLVELKDTLPPELAQGRPRLLEYRVEAFRVAAKDKAGIAGQTAGWSEPAYTAAGSAPPMVAGLQVSGSRLGVVLRWTPAGAADGAVVIEREAAGAGTAKAGATKTVRLATNGAERTLDATAVPDVAYRYTALREVKVQMGGRTVEVRSAPAEPVSFALRLVYPPPVPSGLTVAGFATPATGTEAAGYAVDLIWQPVDDAGMLAPLAGYNVYRETVDAGGHAGARQKLNAAPVGVPAFHDATASAGVGYRYSVTAVDAKGNESAATVAALRD
jgi:hypothetical protein